MRKTPERSRRPGGAAGKSASRKRPIAKRAPSKALDESQPRLVRYPFQPNPGGLLAMAFVPPGLPKNAPLVVVLHGSMQSPEAYDRGAGWTGLAQRQGFAVLYPEQKRANSLNRSFNWFKPGDMGRDDGEPASIKAMIDQICAEHALDRSRIYITGLSSGAAMAGVMLAAYPEIFAGGGLIAGLPYGVARTMPAAFSQMHARGAETDSELGALVRAASTSDGPWPAVSIWHGAEDTTVDASNSAASVAQWLAIHELNEADAVEQPLDGHVHRLWRDAAGRVCVEEYEIAGMRHGTPLDASDPDNSEHAGAYLLDVGVSSTARLAATWGLTDSDAEPADSQMDAGGKRSGARLEPHEKATAEPAYPLPLTFIPPQMQNFIAGALKAAGLGGRRP